MCPPVVPLCGADPGVGKHPLNRLKRSTIFPAKIVGDPLKENDLFHQMMTYIEQTHTMVEPLYELEKEKKLSAEGDGAGEGRAFLEGQLVKGGQMLGDLWYSAWQQAAEDKYLARQLTERNKATNAPPVNATNTPVLREPLHLSKCYR